MTDTRGQAVVTIASRILAGVVVVAVVGVWKFGLDVKGRVDQNTALLQIGPRHTPTMDAEVMGKERVRVDAEIERNKQQNREMEQADAAIKADIRALATTVEAIMSKGIPPPEVERRLAALENGQQRMEDKQDQMMLLLVEFINQRTP